MTSGSGGGAAALNGRHEHDRVALLRENEQLRTALETRVVIEQAKGMLAERLAVDVGDAFERLRREARSRRLSLHVLAAAVTSREPWADAIFRPDGEAPFETPAPR